MMFNILNSCSQDFEYIQHFHIDEGLKPNWKGYPPIGMTTEPLTMSSEYPNPLLSLCRSHSHAGICAYQISLHKDLLLLYSCYSNFSPFLIGWDIKKTSCSSNPAWKKKQSTWKWYNNSEVNECQAYKKEVLSTYHSHLQISGVLFLLS